MCLDCCWPCPVLYGLGVGMGGGENSSCWYFATCLQAAWIQSNKHTTLMNSITKHTCEKDQNSSHACSGTLWGLELRWEGKDIPEPSTMCCRQDHVSRTAKSNWPVCCEAAPATMNSRTTARWSQHVLWKSSSYCILFLFFGRMLSAQLLVWCYTSLPRLLP